MRDYPSKELTVKKEGSELAKEICYQILHKNQAFESILVVIQLM
jgi:hypothetical protein